MSRMFPKGRRLRLRLARLTRREDGASTVEFALAVPIFLLVFLAAFESALLMTRFVMLERSLDIVVRELRLGLMPGIKHDELKAEICSHTVMFGDCMDTLMLELRPVSQTTWAPLNTRATCVDRDAEIQPVTSFLQGAENNMMLVRACAMFDPIFPFTGIGLKLNKADAGGGYALVASSAFVNEPS